MDRNYYQTNVTSLAEEYLHVVDALIIDEVERLRITNYRKDEKIRELEGGKRREDARDAELWRREDGTAGGHDPKHGKTSGCVPETYALML